MTDSEFKRKCYEMYQLDWMKTHGYSLQDAFNVLREGYAECYASGMIDGGTGCDDDFDAMEEYFEEQGFNGNLFVCENEFYDCEYQDIDYMKYLLSPAMFKQYLGELEVNNSENYDAASEQRLMDILEEYKKYVVGELELNLVNGIWLAYDYRKDFESASEIEVKGVNPQVISVEEATNLGIDVRKCCDACNVAYVG